MLVFIPTLGSFVVPDLLGGAKSMMVGSLVQNQFGPARDWPFGSAASFVMMALVLVGVMAMLRFGRSESGSEDARR
jgi:spermidine/putrescine transport system permease protein